MKNIHFNPADGLTEQDPRTQAALVGWAKRMSHTRLLLPSPRRHRHRPTGAIRLRFPGVETRRTWPGGRSMLCSLFRVRKGGPIRDNECEGRLWIGAALFG